MPEEPNKRKPGETARKFLSRVSKKDEAFRDKLEWRKKNRPWINISQEISLRVLSILRSKSIPKETFLDKLVEKDVDVSDIFSGKINFSIETITKMEEILGEKVIFVPSGQICRFCDNNPVAFGETICIPCKKEMEE